MFNLVQMFNKVWSGTHFQNMFSKIKLQLSHHLIFVIVL